MSASPATDFGPLIGPVARRLWGDPNKRLSKPEALRWGNQGARIVYPATGAFKDTEADRAGGTLELIQHTRGCDKGGAIAWLVAEGLIPERADDHAVRLKAGQRIVATFVFRDAAGGVLYRKHRVEPGRGDRRKEFAFDRPDGAGGWVWGRGDDQVPYRLPELIAAPDGSMIYMAEGEAKADRLASWGLVATSLKDWRGFDFSGYVKGRTVVILPDNDDTGAQLAEKVRADVERAEGRPIIVRLPRLPDKGDVLDWDGDATELATLADAAPRSSDEADDWPALDLAACGATKAPEREWVVADWVPANKATLFTGDGGVGKSLMAQLMATCVALGILFMGLHTRGTNAAYVSWEDDADELWRRQEAICAILGVRMADLAGRLFLVSYTEEASPFLVTADDEHGIRVTPLGRKIEQLVERHRIGLLMLDNASQIAGIDHNAVDEVAPFAHWLGTLAKRHGGSVLLLHHTNKAGQDFLGSVAYNNQFRSRLMLARPEDAQDLDLRVLTNPKANYAQAGGTITFRWYKGAFVRDEDLPSDQRAALAAAAAAGFENDAFLECLRQRRSEGDGRQVGPAPGPNYAPTQFEGMAQARGLDRKKLKRAMDRLFKLGRLESVTTYNKAKSRDVTVLSEVAPNPSPNFPNPFPMPSRTDPERTPEPLPNSARTTPHTHPYTTYREAGPLEGPPASLPNDTADEPADVADEPSAASDDDYADWTD